VSCLLVSFLFHWIPPPTWRQKPFLSPNPPPPYVTPCFQFFFPPSRLSFPPVINTSPHDLFFFCLPSRSCNCPFFGLGFLVPNEIPFSPPPFQSRPPVPLLKTKHPSPPALEWRTPTSSVHLHFTNILLILTVPPLFRVAPLFFFFLNFP